MAHPVDFTRVHADDALVDQLGTCGPDAVQGDDLAVLLVRLREEVDAHPFGELIPPHVVQAVLSWRRSA